MKAMPEQATRMPEADREVYVRVVLDPERCTTAIVEIGHHAETLHRAGEAVGRVSTRWANDLPSCLPPDRGSFPARGRPTGNR